LVFTLISSIGVPSFDTSKASSVFHKVTTLSTPSPSDIRQINSPFGVIGSIPLLKALYNPTTRVFSSVHSSEDIFQES